MAIFFKLVASLFLLLSLGSCKDQPDATTEIEFQNPAQGLTIESVNHGRTTWRVVTMDPEKSRPSIRLSDSLGKPLRPFSAFKAAAQEADENIIWI